ncbi:hypothetical protein ACIQUQ_08705 [Streptomyces sp. NPDC101118]|uniref:hypothetical protein n=1 Tax=Streptomyces sp. NPDC101118 TaxID=3366109 RepID=UPI0037FF7837
MSALPRGVRAAFPALLALLLALPVAGAVHRSSATPYGDRLTRHPAPGAAAGAPVLRIEGPAVRAYGPGPGRAPLWTYRREARTPVAVLAAPGHALALWDDGMVTDTGPRGAVRWHRVMPGAAEGALWALDPGTRMLAVVTPGRVSAYRTDDGDLRWTFPAPADCAFRPRGLLRLGRVLLVPRPCEDPARPWNEGLVAIDALGRVSPTRRPLGNERPREATHSPEKQLRTAVRLNPMANLLAD